VARAHARAPRPGQVARGVRGRRTGPSDQGAVGGPVRRLLHGKRRLR
jgi:hypothetical protein